MCMTYLHAEFHLPNSRSSLVIILKAKTKCRYNAAATLLTHILQENFITILAKSSGICYHTQYQETYCRMLVTLHGVWIDNLIYWTFITCNCKWV
jgi:hypothetical protein